MSCHAVKDEVQDAKKAGNFINSVKTAPVIELNSLTADQKSSVTRENVIISDPTDTPAVETNIVIPAEGNIQTVDIVVEPVQTDSDTQGSIMSDPGQSNILLTGEKTSSETITSERESFIIPTNNIKLPETGSVVSDESIPGESATNSLPEAVTEKDKEPFPSSPRTSSSIATEASLAIGSTITSKPSMSTSPDKGTSAPVTSPESSPVTSLPRTVGQSATSEVTTEGFKSTQGTVAPTVTNTVDNRTDDSVIVFKSTNNDDPKHAGNLIATTSVLTADTRSVTKKNTTPNSKTTLNVIKPTTSGTTELVQTVPLNQPEAAEAKMTVDTVTAAKADPKTGQDNVVATMAKAGETTNPASFVEEITNDKTTQTPPAEVSSRSTISTESDPTATKMSTTVSELAKEYNAQTTEENQTKQPVSTSTVGADTSDQKSAVTCPEVICTGLCKYGRKQDARGCETCQCNCK